MTSAKLGGEGQKYRAQKSLDGAAPLDDSGGWIVVSDDGLLCSNMCKAEAELVAVACNSFTSLSAMNEKPGAEQQKPQHYAWCPTGMERVNANALSLMHFVDANSFASLSAMNEAMRAALRNLLHIPAVIDALNPSGYPHINACECPFCRGNALLAQSCARECGYASFRAHTCRLPAGHVGEHNSRADGTGSTWGTDPDDLPLASSRSDV